MARSILNTSLEFGLVSVGVSVMPVESKGDILLHTASAEGNALNQVYLDSITRLESPRDEWQKGMFTEIGDKDDRATWKGFRPIAPEALAAIKEETKLESFEIVGFIPAEDIPSERAKGCYFLAPQRGAASAKHLKLIHDALVASGRAGILKIVIKERQHPAVIYAKNGGLFMNTLAWAEDFARADEAGDAFADAAAKPEAVALAVTLIEQLSVGVEALDELSDDLRPKTAELMEAALAGKAIKATGKKAAEKPTDDLEALLTASVQAASKPKTKTKASSKQATALAA